jgi:predicted esterase
LYFIVPQNYDREKPTGLIVFLHGGGLNTSRDAPDYTLRFAAPGSTETDRSGRMLAGTGMITVGPSAPGKGESYYRWCLKSAEAYLVDVVAECEERFHIDPDRVLLFGHSMGGFGGYHQALRQPDRFAAIVISSGAWDCGYWPVVRGTPFCIAQGVHDAVRGERWHHTDVEYARQTHKIFTREGLEHEYHEHDGGHDISNNRDIVGRYFAENAALHRDAHYPHVTLASPLGFAWNYRHPVRHNRWLTLDETTDGELEYDDLVTRGNDDFDTWRLEHQRYSRRGSMIDAINRGGNRIDVTTLHVARFTVWLNPKMVDVGKPVTIRVDGKVRFSGKVRPSLVSALESYERRRDWGLIYPIKVELKAGR